MSEDPKILSFPSVKKSRLLLMSIPWQHVIWFEIPSHELAMNPPLLPYSKGFPEVLNERAIGFRS